MQFGNGQTCYFSKFLHDWHVFQSHSFYFDRQHSQCLLWQLILQQIPVTSSKSTQTVTTGLETLLVLCDLETLIFQASNQPRSRPKWKHWSHRHSCWSRWRMLKALMLLLTPPNCRSQMHTVNIWSKGSNGRSVNRFTSNEYEIATLSPVQIFWSEKILWAAHTYLLAVCLWALCHVGWLVALSLCVWFDGDLPKYCRWKLP